MFKKALVGDKVYHQGHGWGKITHIDDPEENQDYPIGVTYDDDSGSDSFTLNGNYITEHQVPQLFWEKPEISTECLNMPPRPVNMIPVKGKMYSEDTLQAALENYINPE